MLVPMNVESVLAEKHLAMQGVETNDQRARFDGNSLAAILAAQDLKSYAPDKVSKDDVILAG